MKKILFLILFCFFLIGCKEKEEVVQEKKIESITEANLEESNECTREEVLSGIDIVFVIDSSASMADNDPESLRIEHAKIILNQMLEQDQAHVISFAKDAEFLMTGFSNERSLIDEGLSKIVSNDKFTNLANGLELALSAFESQTNDNHKIIIALTDGENTGIDESEISQINYDTEVAGLQANNKGISIYTIGLGSDVNFTQLEKVAFVSGGLFYHAEESFDLENVYREVIQDINCDSLVEKEKDSNEYAIFESPELAQLINETLGYDINHPLTIEELQKLVSLNSSNIADNDIKSLAGLEKANNLKTLHLYNQTLSDIRVLSKLRNLIDLQINHNNHGMLNLLDDALKTQLANYILNYEQSNGPIELENILIKDLDLNENVDILLTFKKKIDEINQVLNFVLLKVEGSTLELVYNNMKDINQEKEYKVEGRSMKSNLVEYLVQASGHEVGYGTLAIIDDSGKYIVVNHYNGGTQYSDMNHIQKYSFSNNSVVLIEEFSRIRSLACFDEEDEECYNKYPTGQDYIFYPILGGYPANDLVELFEPTKLDWMNPLILNAEQSKQLITNLMKYSTIKINVSNKNTFISDSALRKLFSKHPALSYNISWDDSILDVVDEMENKSSVMQEYVDGGSCYYTNAIMVCHSALTPVDYTITAIDLFLDDSYTVSKIQSYLPHLLVEDSDGPSGYSYYYEYKNQSYFMRFDGNLSNSKLTGIRIKVQNH